MSIIQILLFSMLVSFISWSVLKDFAPWLKLLALIVGGVGIYFVLFPSMANALAHALNVGRGADLMLYFFIVLMFFFSVSFYQKIRLLQNQITRLYRFQAKKEAVKLGKSESSVKKSKGWDMDKSLKNK